MKLYQLADQYRTVEGMFDKYETINNEEIQKMLASIQEELDEKVANIGKLILELKSEALAIKTEEERLYKRRSANNNKVEWLKSYLLAEMQSANVQKVKRDVVTISIRNSPPSIDVEDLSVLPELYIRTIPEVKEADRKAILEHFKETGEVVPGAHVTIDKKYLEVR